MSENLDQFDIKLNEELRNLQECQKNKNLDSCLKCENIMECELRKGYVKAVYESMNKGQGGDFEF